MENKNKNENESSPKTAKLVLAIFGLGPIILMGLFLFNKGFFSSPGSWIDLSEYYLFSMIFAVGLILF